MMRQKTFVQFVENVFQAYEDFIKQDAQTSATASVWLQTQNARECDEALSQMKESLGDMTAANLCKLGSSNNSTPNWFCSNIPAVKADTMQILSDQNKAFSEKMKSINNKLICMQGG